MALITMVVIAIAVIAVGGWLLIIRGGSVAGLGEAITGSGPNDGVAARDRLALVGRWSASSDCSRTIEFKSDGTLVNPGGATGTWAVNDQGLSTSSITISGGGESTEGWLRRHSADHYETYPLDPSNTAPAVHLRRCQ